jgi:hypothetical protein
MRGKELAEGRGELLAASSADAGAGGMADDVAGLDGAGGLEDDMASTVHTDTGQAHGSSD